MADPTDSSTTLERSVLSTILESDHLARFALVGSHLRNALYFSERNHCILWMIMEECATRGEDLTPDSIIEVARKIPAEEALSEFLQLCKIEWEGHLTPDVNALFRRQRHKWQGEEHYRDSLLAFIGGHAWIAEVQSSFVTSAGLERNARLLADYYRLRGLKRTVSNLGRRLEDPGAVDKITDWSAKAVGILIQSVKTEGVSTAQQAGTAALSSKQESFVDHGTFGVPNLDAWVKPQRQYIVVVAARPGVGKSSLAVQYARRTAEKFEYAPGTIAFASLEMGRKDLMEVAIGQELSVSAKAVEEDGLTKEQARLADTYVNQLGDSVIINDGMIFETHKLCQWARAHKQRYPAFHTLVIDHFHCLQSGDKRKDRFQAWAEACAMFKSLRRELDVCILLPCQLNRELMKGTKPRKPRLSDLLGAGSLEQDANIAVFLDCDPDSGLDERPGEFLVLKNRKGRTGTLPYTYMAATGQRFVDTGWVQKDSATKVRMSQEPDPSEDLFE